MQSVRFSLCLLVLIRSAAFSPAADYGLPPGVWKYSIAYRGRAGTLDAYEVRYRPAEEQFSGQRLSTADGS
jgi:hypothetical protein